MPQDVTTGLDGLDEEQRPLVDPAEVAEVQAIMHALVKCGRSFKLYARNNEMLLKFVNDLFEKLTVFLEEKDSLTLTIRPWEFLYGGETVYENDDRSDSFSWKLYKDGVRQLNVFPGLDKKELNDFLDIISTNFDSMDMADEDIVTMLWKHDFNRITYIVVETFTDDIGDDDKQELEMEIDNLVNLVRSDQPPEQAIKAARLSPDDIVAFKRQREEENFEVPDFDDSAAAHVFQVTEGEFARIQKEIEFMESGVGVDQVVNLLFDLIEFEENAADCSLMLDVLLSVYDSYLISGEIKKINAILKRLRYLEKPEYAPKFRFRGAVGKFFQHVAAQDRVEQLLLHLNNQTMKGTTGDLFSFLSMQDQIIVPNVLNHLGEVQAVQSRRLIVDAMILLAKGEIALFANRLSDERWYVVSDMLYALGKIANDKALPHIVGAFKNAHPRVRQEVISSLRKYHNEDIRNMMLRALDDDDSQVRSLALRHLANARDGAAVKSIAERMKDKSFVDRPVEEKKRHFTALAMIGGTQLIPFFREQLTARGVLNKLHLDEMRAGAAAALGIVGSPEALAILQSGAASSNKAIREACEQTLQRLGKLPDPAAQGQPQGGQPQGDQGADGG